MLKIAICDRSKRQQKELLDYIARDTDIGDDYITECFDMVGNLKKRLVNRDFNFDLLFLGVEADGASSIDLATSIRKHKCDVDIIFMAKDMKFITDAFRCKAFNYIVKPVSYERFCNEIFQYIQEKQRHRNEYFPVAIRGKEQLILLNTVQYFASDARKIGIFFEEGRPALWFYGKLDDLERTLGAKGFLRCHQSYLINIAQIESISSKKIEVGHESLPISRKYANSVREGWARYKKISLNRRNRELEYQNGTGERNNEDLFVGITSTLPVTKTKGGLQEREPYGVLIGVRGIRQNNTYRLYDGEEAVLGRDSAQSQIVINAGTISRKHCSIRFNAEEQCYFICDYSKNGTFLYGIKRLETNQWTKVQRNTIVQLVNEKYSFILG